MVQEEALEMGMDWSLREGARPETLNPDP